MTDHGPRHPTLAWRSALLVSGAIVLFLGACTARVAPSQAEMPPGSPTLSPSPTPHPTATARPPATITPLPPPTLHPTPLPTIVIPMLSMALTETVALTATPAPPPAVWDLPERVVPEPFGVEIHFTRASQNELDFLAAGGFRWVRMDMFWHTIETAPGRYDFSEYDVLVREMTRRGIRIVFILDYGNALYDHGFPPTSPGGRAAFARFAAAAARRYRGKGILWEIWNEPNLDHFWTREANARDYGTLALQTIGAIRRADPTALVVAPALAGYEVAFWQTLGEMGLFTKVDALTVHSYGVRTPEALTEPLLALRALIRRHSPHWTPPILSGEWGFASTEGGYTEGQQAQFLARQWLVNLLHDMDLSIWYDWRNDGLEPREPEHNFGTVRNDYTAKPAYRAARTLTTHLAGYRFLRRVPLAREDDYLLLFHSEGRTALAMWTTGEAHTVILPISVTEVAGVGMTGETHTIESEGQGLAVALTESPRYLLFRADQAPAALGSWRPRETIHDVPAGTGATIPVVMTPGEGMPLYGELEVWIDGTLRGRTAVHARPLEETLVRVPVDLAGVTGATAAEVRWVVAGQPMAELQRAAIWVVGE